MPAVVTANNVALGVGDLYTAPADTVRPLDAAIISNVIAAPWVFVGGTNAGVTLAYDQTIQEIRIEEISVAIKRLKTETKFNFSAALVEDTMPTAVLAYNGVLTAIAVGGAGSGIAAKTQVALQDNLSLVAVCFRLINPAGFARLVYVPRAVQGGNVSTAMRRVAAERQYPIMLEATPVQTSDIVILDYPSAAAPP